MMGDSHDNSHDSRFFGCVDPMLIVGKAEGILVSFDKDHTFLALIGRCLSSLYTGVQNGPGASSHWRVPGAVGAGGSEDVRAAFD